MREGGSSWKLLGSHEWICKFTLESAKLFSMRIPKDSFKAPYTLSTKKESGEERKEKKQIVGIVIGLFITACQPASGYFMPWVLEIGFIVRLYLYFLVKLFEFLFFLSGRMRIILNRSIWPIQGTLTSTNVPGQSGPGSNGNEEVIHTSEIPRTGKPSLFYLFIVFCRFFKILCGVLLFDFVFTIKEKDVIVF